MACALLACLCCALAGCVVPRSGPLLRDVLGAQERHDVDLVPVTADIVAATREPERASFPASYFAATPVDFEKLAPGDGLDVTLWGQDGVGIFQPGPGGVTDFGEVVIDRAGNIRLPSMGSIHAEGLTTAGLAEAIRHRLGRLTAGLDVNVRQTDRRGRMVTVQGDLAKPGVYPIGPGTQRLSGVLSLSVPNQANPEQLEITLRREQTSASLRLSDIYRDAAQDVALLPDDSIVVHGVVANVVVLGASGSQSNLRLGRRDYSVLDALGDARGLGDSIADPRAVFLLRSPHVAPAGAPLRPVLYQFDFTRPDQVALARRFVIRNGDVVFVSDAPFTQVQKALSAINATLGASRTATGQ